MSKIQKYQNKEREKEKEMETQRHTISGTGGRMPGSIVFRLRRPLRDGPASEYSAFIEHCKDGMGHTRCEARRRGKECIFLLLALRLRLLELLHIYSLTNKGLKRYKIQKTKQ
jgi:hypothetical protein